MNLKNSFLLAFLFTTISTSVGLADQTGFWKSVMVKAYQPLQDKYLERYASGTTRYGTSVYQEGIAATSRYYPQGTKIFIKMEGDSGKWFTVDDELPENKRKEDLIFVRFLTEAKQKAWKEGSYRVYIVLPID